MYSSYPGLVNHCLRFERASFLYRFCTGSLENPISALRRYSLTEKNPPKPSLEVLILVIAIYLPKMNFGMMTLRIRTTGTASRAPMIPKTFPPMKIELIVTSG